MAFKQIVFHHSIIVFKSPPHDQDQTLLQMVTALLDFSSEFKGTLGAYPGKRFLLQEIQISNVKKDK